MKATILTLGLSICTLLRAQAFLPRTPINGEGVKGAPFSADAVTETTQTAGDGKRIVKSTTGRLYRDSQGRARQEGALITIVDPVSNWSVTLDPDTHTGQKRLAGFFIQAEVGERRSGIAPGPTQVIINDQPVTVTGRMIPGGPQPIPSAEQPGQGAEQPGSKTIEGVLAIGTRTTETGPSGQTVDEVWYSPELKVDVMTRHGDPRTGETVYQLKNIRRAEPDPSLFQVPPDYKVAEIPALVTP